MEDLCIRDATLEDMPRVMKLIGQADMSPDNALSESQVAEIFDQISATPFHRLFVVEAADRIVGTFALIIVQQLSHNGARSVVIEDIVVETAEQGKGIGKQIMGFAVKEAQALGCYKLSLSSGNARKEAHAFYESLGYQQDGIRFALTT